MRFGRPSRAGGTTFQRKCSPTEELASSQRMSPGTPPVGPVIIALGGSPQAAEHRNNGSRAAQCRSFAVHIRVALGLAMGRTPVQEIEKARAGSRKRGILPRRSSAGFLPGTGLFWTYPYYAMSGRASQ